MAGPSHTGDEASDWSFDLGDYESYTYRHDNWTEDSSSHAIAWPLGWNFIVLFVMAVFGIVANSALLMVIVFNRQLRTIANILVGNLAVADLIMFVFNVPSDIVHWHVFNWPDTGLGNFLCKLSGGVWTLAQVLCVASLTAVSIERYCALRWQLHTKRTLVILMSVWVISLVSSVPVMVWATVIRYDQQFSLCHILPMWQNSPARTFVTVGFVLQYLLPLLVITCCYVGMAAILARSGAASTAAAHARRRLAIAVLILNISFAVCWLPNHALILHFLYADFHAIASISLEVYLTLFQIAHVLTYVNSCLNPVIVFTISVVHRQSLVHFLRCCLRSEATSVDGNADPNDRYARVPEDIAVSETDDVEEKA